MMRELGMSDACMNVFSVQFSVLGIYACISPLVSHCATDAEQNPSRSLARTATRPPPPRPQCFPQDEMATKDGGGNEPIAVVASWLQGQGSRIKEQGSRI